MCTERASRVRGVVCGALGLLVLTTCAVASADDPVSAARAWREGTAPVLVVVVAEGLRPDFVQAPAVWSGMRMPRTAAWADSSWSFEDVQSEFTEPARALPRLARGLRAWREAGFELRTVIAPTDLRELEDPTWREWVENSTLEGPPGPARSTAQKNAQWGAQEESAVFDALDAALRADSPQLVVAAVDFLLPPYLLPRDLTVERDPRPWSLPGTLDPVHIEETIQRRLNSALELAARTELPRMDGQPLVREEFAWVLSAAHGRFDRFFGRLLDRVAQAEGSSRVSVLLTATAATGSGEQRWAGPARGARSEVSQVPLLWNVPGASPLRDDAPRRLGDLFDTVRFLTGAGDEPGILGAAEASRDRFSFGAGEAPGLGKPVPVAEVRWTTPGFTLLETVLPSRGRYLYDRRYDADERADRGWAQESVADSLRDALRNHLYGSDPRLRLTARDLQGQTIRLPSRKPLRVVEGEGAARNTRGEIVWTVPRTQAELVLDFPEGIEGVAVGGEGFDLRLGGRDPIPVRGRVDLDLHGPLFLAAFDAVPEGEARPGLRLRLELDEGWLSEDRER